MKGNCKKAWEAWEKGYLDKPGGKEEAARERREFYCDNGTIKLRPSTDADVPLTDKEIRKSKKSSPAKAKNLEEVVTQLEGAVIAHGKQAKTIKKHINDMKESPAKMSFNKSFCGKSPLKARGDKTGTSKGGILKDGYNTRTTYRENKAGDKVKRKEYTKVLRKDAFTGDFTGGEQMYREGSNYTSQLKKYNRKGELKKTKTVTAEGGNRKAHQKLRKKYYRGNKVVSHKKI